MIHTELKSKELNINFRMNSEFLHVLVKQIITFTLHRHWSS